MLLRIAYLGVKNVFALLRLLPSNDRDKDVEIRAVDLFALALTGRDDARLYDGSLTEWGAHPDLPLVTS